MVAVFTTGKQWTVTVWEVKPATLRVSNTGQKPQPDHPPRAKTRVVVADDHPMVRAAIRDMLEKADDIELVGEASNGLEALRMANELLPEVLLVDLEMPILHGAEVTRALQEAASPVKVLAISGYNDRQVIISMLESGASGFVAKDEAPALIVDAIREIAQGADRWLSKATSASLFS